MSLQHKIFQRYYSAVPKLTYRQISKETGIQITRVFRIVNGSKMKLEEYQAVEQAINRHVEPTDYFEFLQLAKNCAEVLSSEALAELKGHLTRKVSLANNLSVGN